MIASISSSGDAVCLICLPHFSHLWVMIIFSPDFSAAIAGISPRHVAARSPGLLSTCRDHKHCGQWFVYPLPATYAPQWAQVKSSTRLVNFFKVTTPTHCDTSGLIRRPRPINRGPICAHVSFGEYISGRIRRISPRNKFL